MREFRRGVKKFPKDHASRVITVAGLPDVITPRLARIGVFGAGHVPEE